MGFESWCTSVLLANMGGKSGNLFSSGKLAGFSGLSSDLMSFSGFSSIGLTEGSRIISSSPVLSSLDPIILSMVNPEPLGLLDKLVDVVEGLSEGGEIGIRGRGGKVPISGNPGFPSGCSAKFPGGEDLGGNGGGQGGGIKSSCPPIGGMGGGKNGGWGRGGGGGAAACCMVY